MRSHLPLVVLLIGLCTSPSIAGDPPAPKLDSALADVEPLDHQFIFSVEADRVDLPKKPEGEAVPSGIGDPVIHGASVDQIGIAYNRSERNFGNLRAVAPPTMVVLSTNPSDPNIYDGMPQWDSFVLLADSLTDSQWQAMTSAAGLSVGDLTEGRQRDLFMALLPHNRLKIAPWYANSLMYTEKDTRDLTSSIKETRVRIVRKPTAMIMYDGKSGSQQNEIPDADNTDRWKLVSPENWGGSKDTVFGVRVRAELPNMPKVAEIDYKSSALNLPVDITRLHTVADLVKALALSTHLELYADARLEPAKLTVIPPKTTISLPGGEARGGVIPTAGDLMQAVAFCVTGTWRQVGPAFILTDDIAGIGTRTQQLYEFERHGDALRKDPLYDAGEDMLKRHSPNDIGWLGAPEAWTDKQMGGQHYAGKQASFVPQIDGPMGDLTPAQQSLVLRADKQFASDYSWQYKQEGNAPPGPKTRVELMAQIDVQIIVPTVIKPVETGVVVDDSQLFQTRPDPHENDNRGSSPRTYAQMAEYLRQHPDVLERMKKQNPAMVDRILNPSAAKPVDVRRSLADIPHRAVIVSATSAADAQSIVDQTKAAGFNEVWLLIFDNGKADVGASTLSKSTALVNGKDVLDAAVEEGRKQGVDVYAALNLLAWGSDPPKGASDFTITGETSAQAWARENVYLADHDSNLDYEVGMMALDRPLDPTSTYVNPFTPKVAEPLIDLIRNIAHHTGIKGMVWREISPTGYGPVHPEYTTSTLPLGFNEDLRLAFIRGSHVDPIDIVSPNYYTGLANTSLPNFEDDNSVLNDIVPKWLQYRHDSAVAFLQHLFDTAQSAGNGALTIITTPSGRSQIPQTSYETWDERNVIPTNHMQGETARMGQDAAPPVVEAHRLTYKPLTLDAIVDLRNPESMSFGGAIKGEAAVVVDLTGIQATSTNDPMKALTDSVGPPMSGG